MAVVQYTFTRKQYIERHKYFGGVRAVRRLCEIYPGICLTTEEKAWKSLSQARKEPQWGRKYVQETGNKDWEDRRLRRRVKET